MITIFQSIKNLVSVIRWPNLLMMLLTQVLFTFVFFVSISPDLKRILIFVVISTLFIAASGYLINDIYDEETDKINRPDNHYIGKSISKETGVIVYLIVLTLGIIATILLYRFTQLAMLLILNLMSIGILFVYSAYLKRTTLAGNIVVALLSAWVILIMVPIAMQEQLPQQTIYLLWGYGFFAFVTTLIRECIKDIEDIEGDRLQEMNTMPIKFGVKAAKDYITGLTTLLGLCLSVLIFYFILEFSWWLGFYILFLILLPVVYLLKSIYFANNRRELHHLSTICKLIMGMGILSALFFIN